jgi:AcrR family transcriptional regulator
VPAEGRELRSRGEATLRKLLDAGIEVFGRRGLHSARVDDIVKVARTSHGTFYLYFANKEDLFRALALDVAQTMGELARSFPPVAPTPVGHAALREWLGQFIDVHRRYAPVIRAWTEAEVGDSDVGRLGTEVLGGLVAALGARIAESGMAAPPPGAAALAVVAMIERLNYYAAVGQVGADREQLLDTLTALVQASLFGIREG